MEIYFSKLVQAFSLFTNEEKGAKIIIISMIWKTLEKSEILAKIESGQQILSVNASIEATRAEKGFSVVADQEVVSKGIE